MASITRMKTQACQTSLLLCGVTRIVAISSLHAATSSLQSQSFDRDGAKWKKYHLSCLLTMLQWKYQSRKRQSSTMTLVQGLINTTEGAKMISTLRRRLEHWIGPSVWTLQSVVGLWWMHTLHQLHLFAYNEEHTLKFVARGCTVGNNGKLDIKM